jgi:hypothetical protein
MRHSGLADIKPLGNLLIFQALADQLNHFLLARSDRCNLALLRTLSFVSSIQKFIEYALRHCVLKPKSSAGYLANRKRNIVSRLFTLKNSPGAATQSFFRKVRIFPASQQDYACVMELGNQLLKRV